MKNKSDHVKYKIDKFNLCFAIGALIFVALSVFQYFQLKENGYIKSSKAFGTFYASDTGAYLQLIGIFTFSTIALLVCVGIEVRRYRKYRKNLK